MVGNRLAKLVKMMVNVDVDQIHICFGRGLLLPWPPPVGKFH